MATTDDRLPRNQRLAIYYKRRERFERWVREDKDLSRLMYQVHMLEINLQMYFDNVQFYHEVANPRLCTIID